MNFFTPYPATNAIPAGIKIRLTRTDLLSCFAETKLLFKCFNWSSAVTSSFFLSFLISSNFFILSVMALMDLLVNIFQDHIDNRIGYQRMPEYQNDSDENQVNAGYYSKPCQEGTKVHGKSDGQRQRAKQQ